MKKIIFFVKQGGTGGTAGPNRLKASKHKGFIGPGRRSRHFIGGTRNVNQRLCIKSLRFNFFSFGFVEYVYIGAIVVKRFCGVHS